MVRGCIDVTSPKRHQPKQYQLTLADAMDKDAQAYAIKQIANGILLEGETEKTRPAVLSFIDETHAVLTLTEGKISSSQTHDGILW